LTWRLPGAVETATVRRSTVGICEDDPDLRATLTRALEAEGIDARATATGHEAVTAFATSPTDALVLDIVLPDADGRDVCQALRAQGVESPVLFLTARDALVDRLAGFHAGGDDYLTKPFALAELLVRVGALLRRAPAASPTELGAGMRLDPAGHALHHGDRSEPLTPTEFRLLAALAAHPGRVVRRRELVAAGWPHGAIVHDNTLDSYVARLRRKLRALGGGVILATVRGVGYRLQG
jgi:two-component system, OmpR family, response regulator